MILDALTLSEHDAPVLSLIEAFGGAPARVSEVLVGEPAVLSRRLRFASGGELILQDDALVAVILHTVPTAHSPSAIDLSEWLEGVGNAATLDDLKKVITGRRRFAGFGTPYFELDGGYARAEFRDHRGWNDPGNLIALVCTLDQPGLVVRPEDDTCPSCSGLVARDGAGAFDLERTVEAIAAALAAGLLKESASWVRLSDLRPLHASGLMERVESQLTCLTCRRILCITLVRGAAPIVSHLALDQAQRHRLGVIPPVGRWGDAARIAEEREAMRYVDHEPGRWFLVAQGEQLYLDARYVVTNMVDDSALICLEEEELEQYRHAGRAYLTELAGRIHDGSPHRESSPYFSRDLRRGPEGAAYREAVSRAIVNHTWMAGRRQRD